MKNMCFGYDHVIDSANFVDKIWEQQNMAK